MSVTLSPPSRSTPLIVVSFKTVSPVANVEKWQFIEYSFHIFPLLNFTLFKNLIEYLINVRVYWILPRNYTIGIGFRIIPNKIIGCKCI